MHFLSDSEQIEVQVENKRLKQLNAELVSVLIDTRNSGFVPANTVTYRRLVHWINQCGKGE